MLSTIKNISSNQAFPSNFSLNKNLLPLIGVYIHLLSVVKHNLNLPISSGMYYKNLCNCKMPQLPMNRFV